jgi:hypothetical protein
LQDHQNVFQAVERRERLHRDLHELRAGPGVNDNTHWETLGIDLILARGENSLACLHVFTVGHITQRGERPVEPLQDSMNPRTFEQAGDAAIRIGYQKHLGRIGERVQNLADDALGNHYRKVRLEPGVRALIDQNDACCLARSRAEDLGSQRRERRLLAQIKKHLEALAFRRLLAQALVLDRHRFEFALQRLILAVRRPQVNIAVPNAAHGSSGRIAGALKRPHHVHHAAADQRDVLIAAQLIGHQEKLS